MNFEEQMRLGARGAALYVGDCRTALRGIPDASVDSVVCDPPYELGFMGKGWDASGVAFDPDTWREALRILKPGGHLLAFGGSRTYHRMTCAIEDAGFEIRDQIMWIYGSGFPKSHNGEWGGTALKPAHEPIVLARKALVGTVEANWREHGAGALNIDGCRIESGGEHMVSGIVTKRTTVSGDEREGASLGMYGAGSTFTPTNHPGGRWPANLIHDGSDEVLDAFPDAQGQLATSSSDTRETQNTYGEMRRGSERRHEPRREVDKSAARFFYCAKPSKSERGEGNTHPTVKPVNLMRYLCRLITPAGGVVLDPFLGSGSTGVAALAEGFRFIGCELTPEYLEIATRRILASAN